MVSEMLESIWSYLTSTPEMADKFLGTLAVIAILWLFRSVAVRIVERNIGEKWSQYKWRKNLSYLIAFVGILIIGRIWFEALQSLATFFGLLSAGVAIALREPLSDIAAWIYLVSRSPFKVGDRIEIGEIKGDVVDTRVFKFTLLEVGHSIFADQSTGRVIHVPNHRIFSKSIANYTSDFSFVWNEIQVIITHESDWRKAKRKLQEIADYHLKDYIHEAKRQIREANKSYLIYYRHLTPTVYTRIEDRGISLTIRHLIAPRKQRDVAQLLWEDILDAFHESDELKLAYPTTRIFSGPEND